MKKETLIQKWLDGELSPAEMEAFRKLEEADDYLKLSKNAKHFKAPQFDTPENYDELRAKLSKTKKVSRTSVLLKIAAVFVLGFGAYFTYFSNSETFVETIAGTTEKIVLPDGSEVLLNAVTTLRFEPGDWRQKRKVHLKGEAFFIVEEGKRFDVITPSGVISVVGTQFNVVQRGAYFDVTCYDGVVEVKTPKKNLLLEAGESFRSLYNKTRLDITQNTQPSWINNISSFQSVPYKMVLAEFERQYNLEVRLKSSTFDTNQLFTGSFAHNDLERALQSVTVPFNLAYTLSDDVVILRVRE